MILPSVSLIWESSGADKQGRLQRQVSLVRLRLEAIQGLTTESLCKVTLHTGKPTSHEAS